jgi:hypothetical protein
MAAGAKTIETRSWSSQYRGPVAIYAGKGLGGLGQGATEADLADAIVQEPFRAALAAVGIYAALDLPRGVIVAVGDLVQCERTVENGRLHPDIAGRFAVAPDEADFGNYDPGRFAWMFNDLSALPEPAVIQKGAVPDYRGLWDVPSGLDRDLTRALRVAA